MADVAIRCEKLGKRYRLGASGAGYNTLRESLMAAATAPLRRIRHGRRQSEHVWALRDVDLEVERGEVLGVIGRNGAGKTTLLKILSRITEPTTGRAELHGRVGSLLEVGTGFHPELTGRENIFLNGAILGMRRAEIDRKFDEIVAFAEVERFLDTPVKHYSSGMYVRLAFAVAAHLEPEILFVDEVLSVGDASFQEKCLGKMDEVSKEGRTVLFVTHQLTAVRRLCTRVLWLDCGRIRNSGAVGATVSSYEQGAETAPASSDSRSRHLPGPVEFSGWRLHSDDSGEGHRLSTCAKVKVVFSLTVSRPVRFARHGIALFDSKGLLVWGNAVQGLSFDVGSYELTHELVGLPIKPGVYRWRVSLYEGAATLDVWEGVPPLSVDTLQVTHYQDSWAGILNVPSQFSFCAKG